jgi:hypothetical protein
MASDVMTGANEALYIPPALPVIHDIKGTKREEKRKKKNFFWPIQESQRQLLSPEAGNR